MLFREWLDRQARRPDPIGDLARDVREDPPPDRVQTPLSLFRWVRVRHIHVARECLLTIAAARHEYRRSRQRRRVSLRTRFLVLRRDGYACQLCGRTARDGAVLEVDHRMARARGGTDDEHNLWTLCFDCNRGKRTDAP